jgi:hypothetical protein
LREYREKLIEQYEAYNSFTNTEDVLEEIKTVQGRNCGGWAASKSISARFIINGSLERFNDRDPYPQTTP